MKPFERLHAVALPIAQPNVDTDQILPARYLQKPRANDFGQYLFRDVRYRKDGTENREFLLNRSEYRNARIVVAERNFGCGSSREHAVWALADYGIRAVIAPSFGDIFAGNAAKNGLLPIVLPASAVSAMIERLLSSPGATLDVDLEHQVVVAPDGSRHEFAIDPFVKQSLLRGLDEIDYTLTLLDRIVEFERCHENAMQKE